MVHRAGIIRVSGSFHRSSNLRLQGWEEGRAEGSRRSCQDGIVVQSSSAGRSHRLVFDEEFDCAEHRAWIVGAGDKLWSGSSIDSVPIWHRCGFEAEIFRPSSQWRARR